MFIVKPCGGSEMVCFFSPKRGALIRAQGNTLGFLDGENEKP